MFCVHKVHVHLLEAEHMLSLSAYVTHSINSHSHSLVSLEERTPLGVGILHLHSLSRLQSGVKGQTTYMLSQQVLPSACSLAPDLSLVKWGHRGAE